MPAEVRFVESEGIELRAVEGTEDRFVEGVGVVYGKEVEIWPGFREKIRAGAFNKTLQGGSEIKSFFNHDASQVLATTRSNPALEIQDTDKGLRFKAPIPPTSYGNDLRVNLERKNVRGASFSFDVDEEGDIITRDEKGVYHREITSATMYEVGPVTNPAYPQTSVSLRSIEQTQKECIERCNQKSGAAEIELQNNELQLRKRKLYLTERSL